MKVQKFNYNGVLREILVTEESATHLKGYDYKYLSEPEKETLNTFLTAGEMSDRCKDVSDKIINQIIEYARPTMSFRCFKKSNITPLKEN